MTPTFVAKARRWGEAAKTEFIRDLIDVLYVHGFTRSEIRLFIYQTCSPDEGVTAAALRWMDALDWSHYPDED